MKKFLRSLLLIIILFSLSGCQHALTTPTQDQISLTPQTIMPDATTITTPTPTLDTATQRLLQLYPLRTGSTWIYAYLGYDQGMEVVWHVKETVVNTHIVEGYYVVVMERIVELVDGNPSQNFFRVPANGTFWYLVDGQNLYRFDSLLSTNLSRAWLDLVLPFPKNGEAWYPHPDQRSHINMSITGFRYASAPFEKVLPMGGTYTCYNVAMRFMDATEEGTFCETVGFVYQEFNFFNRSFGYRSELRSFSIP